jgi:hypothetical protein
VAAQLTAARSEAEADSVRAEASLAELQNRNASLEHVAAQQCSVSEQLARDKAALEQVIADLRNENSRLLGSAAVSEQQLRAIEQSTTWRATALLRAVAARLPQPARRNLRRAARAAYWVLTPHRIPTRFRASRELHRVVSPMPVAQGSENGAPSAAHPQEGLNNSKLAYSSPRQPREFGAELLPPEWLRRNDIVTEDPDFAHSIDEIIAFRDLLFLSGSAAHRQKRIVAVFVVFHNSVQRIAVTNRSQEPLRFDFRLALPEDQPDANIGAGFEFDDGSRFVVEVPYLESWRRDPYHRVFAEFQTMVRRIGRGQILEIGSRARSGNVHRDFIPDGMKYVGMDILDGPNVDVVADAHELSRHFAPETFDVAYSIAVFEHLLMPWKVTIELNKILKPGGFVFIATHQTFNLHEQPWDFWRFSDKAWHGLFNEFTGFEVVTAEMGERAYIVGSFLNGMTFKMDQSPAFLASTAICRKIGPCREDWHADLPSLVKSIYPH